MIKPGVLDALSLASIEEPIAYVTQNYDVREFMLTFSSFTEELFPDTVKVDTADIRRGFITVSLRGLAFFLRTIISSIIIHRNIDVKISAKEYAVCIDINYGNARIDLEKLARIASSSGLFLESSEDGRAVFIIPITPCINLKLYSISLDRFKYMLYDVFFS